MMLNSAFNNVVIVVVVATISQSASIIRNVLECVENNEELCESAKTCVDKIPSNMNPSAVSLCWYEHRAEVRAQLEFCLQTRGLLDTPCWKHSEGVISEVQENIPAECRWEDPFEAAKSCWLSTCIKSEQCSSSCDADQNMTAALVMHDCLKANISSLMGKLGICVQNATNQTTLASVQPEVVPTRDGDSVAAVERCIADSQRKCREKNMCVSCIAPTLGVNKDGLAKCWYDSQERMTTDLQSCLELNKLSDLRCWSFDHLMPHQRHRRFADAMGVEPFQASLQCWMRNCANLQLCSYKCPGTQPNEAVMRLLEGCYERAESNTSKFFSNCTKNFVPPGFLHNLTEGRTDEKCLGQEKPIVANLTRTTVRQVATCVQNAETVCKEKGNCGCALPSNMNIAGIANCWHQHREAVRAKFISCLTTKNILDSPDLCSGVGRQTMPSSYPLLGTGETWAHHLTELSIVGLQAVVFPCRSALAGTGSNNTNETFRFCFASAEEETRAELLRCVAQVVPTSLPVEPSKPDFKVEIEGKKSDLNRREWPQAVKDGLRGLMNWVAGNN